MKHSTRIILAFAILILLTTSAHAELNNPWQPRPFCFFGMPYAGHAVMRNGKGLMIDMLKAVFEREKVDFEHKVMPYDNAVEAVEKGTIHCTLDLEQRHKNLQAKVTPAFYDLGVAYLRSTEFKNMKSLAGKRVAYVHGFGLQQFLPVKIRPQLVYDLSSGFHMLERGNATYVMGDARLLKEAMFESKIPAGIFEIKKLMSFKLKFIFAPTKEGRLFRDIYDRRMKEMMKSGHFQEIMKSYGSTKQNIQRILDANR